MSQFRDKLTQENIELIETKIQEAKSLHGNTSSKAEDLRAAKTGLDAEVMKIGQMVYQNAEASTEGEGKKDDKKDN